MENYTDNEQWTTDKLRMHIADLLFEREAAPNERKRREVVQTLGYAAFELQSRVAEEIVPATENIAS